MKKIILMFLVLGLIPLVNANSFLDQVVLYHPFLPEEQGGTISVDLSGNWHNASTGSPPCVWENTTSPIDGSSINTTDSGICDTNSVDTITTSELDDELSISFWAIVNPDSISDLNQYMVGMGSGTARFNVRINDSAAFVERNGPNCPVFNHGIPDGQTFFTSNYHHFVWVYNQSSDVNLYIDGNFRGFTDCNGFANNNPTIFRYYHNEVNGNVFHGSIDEVGVWNRTLSEDEITVLYNGGSGLNPFGAGANITLGVPINDTNFTEQQSIFFNATMEPLSLSNITNGTIFLWLNGTEITSSITTYTGQNTTAEINMSFTPTQNGDYEWNVLGCSDNVILSICNFAENNFTFSMFSPLLEINQTFEGETFDTDNQTFEITTSIILPVVNVFGILEYNGTDFATSSSVILGTSANLTVTIDIPIVNTQQNRSFFWRITTITDDGNVSQQNSSTNNQTVFPSLLDDCSSQPFTTVNYTIFREDTRTHMSSPLEISFEWFLGGGSVVKNASFDDATEVNHLFCMNAQNETYFTTARMDTEVSGFQDQQYDFLLERYTNITTHQLLGMVNESASSDIIIKVRDTGSQPLFGWMVQIFKFYPELNEHLLVGSRITDSFGQFEESLIERNVRYRFEFYDTTRRLRQEENGIVTCELSFCFIEFVIEDILDIFDIYGDIEGYERSLDFINSSSSFLFSWSDSTGNSPTHRLLVQRIALNQTFIVCNSTSTSIVGSLSCPVGNQSASYIAQGFRKVGNEENRVVLLTIRIADISITIGIEGFFWSFLLTMTLLGVGAWNPPVGIGLYLAGFVLLGGFGIFHMPPELFFSGLVIGILFIWALKS